MNVQPLPGPFGVEIEDIVLSSNLEADTVERLINLLHNHRVIVIRGQSLEPANFLRFGEHFGRPHPHVLTHRRMEGYPAMLTVSNISQPGAPFINGAAHWHTDQSYEQEPASATMLYSIKAPQEGGRTGYVDMAHAYDTLDDDDKHLLEDLQVEHLYGPGIAAREGEIMPSPLVGKEQREAVPAVRHRLVRPHPVTGRKTLYSPCGTSRGIVGMTSEAAGKLLNELAEYALQPTNQYWHQYRVGDVIVWDTAATMHCASLNHEATCEEDTRVLLRISVKGLPPSLT